MFQVMVPAEDHPCMAHRHSTAALANPGLVFDRINSQYIMDCYPIKKQQEMCHARALPNNYLNKTKYWGLFLRET